MKYAVTIIMLTLTLVLHASSAYPKLFEQQSVPLFKSSETFTSLKKHKPLHQPVTDYISKVDKTIQMGKLAEYSNHESVKKAYLKALRSLQKDHDAIVRLSAKELTNAISKNSYETFLNLVNSSMEYYKNKPSLNKKIMTYYEKNRQQGKSAVLEKIIQNEKSYKQVYNSIDHTAYTSYTPPKKTAPKSTQKKREIILLSRPGCPYCVKAKAVLDSKNANYKEYNIRESYGNSLFKKYNGTGVPIIIIGDKVLRGFSEKAILAAL